MMTPEPTTVSNRRWGLALLIFIDWIDTTDGETRSNSMVRDSVHGWADAPAGTSSARASATQRRMDPDDTPRRDAARQAREYNRAVMRRLSTLGSVLLLLLVALVAPGPAAAQSTRTVVATTLDNG